MTFYRTFDGLPGLAIEEWRSGRLSGVMLTDRDQRLADQLRARARDTRVDVTSVGDEVSVTASGAVGVVRFSTCEVRVDPKLPGDHLGLFRMVEFAQGLKGLTELASSPAIEARGSSLLDLFVAMLCRFAERLLLAGLRADYVERVDALPAVRGRLLPDRQALERFGMYDRVVCRYDEHEHDIPDNQLIALGLAVGARVATDPRVRRHARGLAATLEEFCEPRALESGRTRESFDYSRHNEHYRAPHELVRLILDSLGPDDQLNRGPARVRSFLIDMGALFERFLERLLDQALMRSDLRAVRQRTDSIVWRPSEGVRYGSRIRPDLLVESRDGRRVPIDAKYKRYDTRTLDSGDLAQVFLYAYAYRTSNAQDHSPRALLIHPGETRGESRVMPLQVRSVGQRLVEADLLVIGLHIPTMLDEAAQGYGPETARLISLLEGAL